MPLQPIDVDELLEQRVQSQPITLRLLTMGLHALSSRALVWVAAIGGGAIWAFAVWEPEGLRLLAALGYSVSILFPILWRDTKS